MTISENWLLVLCLQIDACLTRNLGWEYTCICILFFMFSQVCVL